MKTERKEFIKGPAKGFAYFVPVPETLEDAVKTYGEQNVLELVSNAIEGRIRAKVVNSLGLAEIKPAEVQAYLADKLAKTGGVLYSENDALAWRPDIRELSPAGLVKKINELLQQGNREAAKALAVKLQEKIAQVVEE